METNAMNNQLQRQVKHWKTIAMKNVSGRGTTVSIGELEQELDFDEMQDGQASYMSDPDASLLDEAKADVNRLKEIVRASKLLFLL